MMVYFLDGILLLDCVDVAVIHIIILKPELRSILEIYPAVCDGASFCQMCYNPANRFQN